MDRSIKTNRSKYVECTKIKEINCVSMLSNYTESKSFEHHFA